MAGGTQPSLRDGICKRENQKYDMKHDPGGPAAGNRMTYTGFADMMG
jgi:hypothetical protein